MTNSIEPSEAAEAMRNLTTTERDDAIRSAGNVLDLRPKLDVIRRNREIAARYRRPSGGGAA